MNDAQINGQATDDASFNNLAMAFEQAHPKQPSVAAYVNLIMHLIDLTPGNSDTPSRLRVGNLTRVTGAISVLNANKELIMFDPDDARYIIKTSDYRKTQEHKAKLKAQQEADRQKAHTSKEYYQELITAGIPKAIVDTLMAQGMKQGLENLREVINKLVPPSK